MAKSFVKALIADSWFSNLHFAESIREGFEFMWSNCCKSKMDQQFQLSVPSFSGRIAQFRGLGCILGGEGIGATTTHDLCFIYFTRRNAEKAAKALWQAQYDNAGGMWNDMKIDTLEEWVELMTA